MNQLIKNYFRNFYNCITMATVMFFSTPFKVLQSITRILIITFLYYIIIAMYLINAIANSKKIEVMIIEIFNFIIFTFKE